MSAASRERFALVDSMRGVLALLVVLQHTAKFVPLAGSSRGFFVIGAFLMCHLLLAHDPNGKHAWLTLVRRVARITAPFWVALILVVTVDYLVRFCVPTSRRVMFTPLEFLANAFYVNFMLGIRPIMLPMWTLSIDFQFTILFMGVHYLTSGRVLRSLVQCDTWPARLFHVAGFPLAWYSLTYLTVKFPPMEATLLNQWYLFHLGITAFAAIRSKWALGCLALVGCAYFLPTLAWPIMSLQFVVAATLALGGHWQRLGSILNYALYGWLGRISFSLFVTHAFVLTNLSSIADKTIGFQGGWGILWLLSTLAACIAFATVFHRLVEEPIGRYIRDKFPLKRTGNPAQMKVETAVEAVLPTVTHAPLTDQEADPKAIASPG
jgi:peptidoglycan/LPS O-acetylase OafA/YrhL